MEARRWAASEAEVRAVMGVPLQVHNRWDLAAYEHVERRFSASSGEVR